MSTRARDIRTGIDPAGEILVGRTVSTDRRVRELVLTKAGDDLRRKLD